MRLLIGAAALAGLSSLTVAYPAFAQACPAGWSKPERHLASRTPLMKFALKPGTAVGIGLVPRGQVTLSSGQVRKGYGGLAALDVTRAGTLRVILSNKTYVDLVRGGKVMTLAAKSHAQDCPGARKTLEFVVEPGRYLIELSGSPEPSVRMATVLR